MRGTDLTLDDLDLVAELLLAACAKLARPARRGRPAGQPIPDLDHAPTGATNRKPIPSLRVTDRSHQIETPIPAAMSAMVVTAQTGT